jgi:predicted esterase
MLNIVPFLCTPELAMFAFDFPGCGVSEGRATPLDGSGCELVLGAVRHLRAQFQFTQFALWGRSLGAAIALHTVSTTNDFRCVVADSSFASTRKFLYDQARANRIPQCLINLVLPIVQAQARRTTAVNIDYPFPINFVQYAQTPVMLGHGSRDRFVPFTHCEAIFERYGSANKQLCRFDSKHNSPRPSHWYRTVARFIYRHLGMDAQVRSYDAVYSSAKLHVGEREAVRLEIQEAKEREGREKEAAMEPKPPEVNEGEEVQADAQIGSGSVPEEHEQAPDGSSDSAEWPIHGPTGNLTTTNCVLP